MGKGDKKIIGFIYKYLSNGPLSSFLNDEKFGNNQLFLLMIITRIFLGIEYLHKNELIHRDLKPSNIFFDHDNLPYILDFETVKSIDNDSPMTYFFSYYLSPEQKQGLKISYHTDIYSFGLIIFL